MQKHLIKRVVNDYISFEKGQLLGIWDGAKGLVTGLPFMQMIKEIGSGCPSLRHPITALKAKWQGFKNSVTGLYGEATGKQGAGGIGHASGLIGFQIAVGILTAGAGAPAAGVEAEEAVAETELTGPELSTGFKGGAGYELRNMSGQITQNTADTVDGLSFTGHALDQMRNRGIMPSVVKQALRYGDRSAGKTPGTMMYFDPANKVTVVWSTTTKSVVTVFRGGGR